MALTFDELCSELLCSRGPPPAWLTPWSATSSLKVGPPLTRWFVPLLWLGWLMLRPKKAVALSVCSTIGSLASLLTGYTE